AAMAKRHLSAGADALGPPTQYARRRAEVARRFGDEPRRVEQLVTFEHQLFVPRTGGQTEGEPEPLLTQPPLGLGGGILRPSVKSILDPRKRLGLAFAPVLPWEIAVPTLPHSLGRAGGARLAHQREISDDERLQA